MQEGTVSGLEHPGRMDRFCPLFLSSFPGFFHPGFWFSSRRSGFQWGPASRSCVAAELSLVAASVSQQGLWNAFGRLTAGGESDQPPWIAISGQRLLAFLAAGPCA